MNEQQGVSPMLSAYRALDLTDEKGFLCGKILSDLGADVIKVERPRGDLSRNIGPFYHDIPDQEKSLHWFAYNSNKRGITLNIETRDGQEIFKRLVKTADFVIESFPPSYMGGLGLGYSELSIINPQIIMTSITPFGQAGPYKDYKASDLVVSAMGGWSYLLGENDGPPVRITFPQVYLHACNHAAVGTLIALSHRTKTGQGQHVDVSAQQSTIWLLNRAPMFWDIKREILKRFGIYWAGESITGVLTQHTWQCRDGYVVFIVLGGLPGVATNRSLVQWMDEEGIADDFLKSMDWTNFDLTAVTPEDYEHIRDAISRFFSKHTMAELYEGAVKRRLMLCPVNTTKDIYNDPQLEARDFWQEVEHPELKATISYPRAFIRSTEASCHVRRPAPLIGEHNQEIYEKELGLSNEELVTLKQGGVV